MRIKEKFFVDDAYLNGYAKLCGTNATLVYLCLCRHSDRHQESFPSVELMAEKLGVSRDSVIRGIKTLVSWNIISKERERRTNATWLNNRYILLDKTTWKPKPSSPQQHGEPSSKSDPIQVANEVVSQVAVSDTKDTHRPEGYTYKDTHTPALRSGDEISKVIYLFKVINPTIEKMYGRPPQREAAERLLKLHPIEWWERFMEAYAQKLSDKFCPRATTPIQMEDKFGAICAYGYSLKGKTTTNVKWI